MDPIWCSREASHPGGTDLTEHMLNRIRENHWLKDHSTFLDLGCGSGTTISLLNKYGYEAYGIDLEQAVPSQNIIKGSCETLPWEDSFFDGIIAECTLSILPMNTVSEEIRRVLKPKGILLLSDLYPVDSDTFPEELSGFRTLYREDVTHLLKSYISRWIWEHRCPPPPCMLNNRKVSLKELGYYYAILQKI